MMVRTDADKMIVDTINDLSGKRSCHAIFSDWVECAAIAIQNSGCIFEDDLWMKRENRYLSVISRYEKDEQFKLSEMLWLLQMSLEERMHDALGEIYMNIGSGAKQTGQFFTPYHVSELVAEMAIANRLTDEEIAISEPSCGGGGMIIAVAAALRKREINYQKKMRVVAQDLDWRSVHMTYVQLSLLGISAEVVQGDTLCQPYQRSKYPRENVLLTPARMGVIV